MDGPRAAHSQTLAWTRAEPTNKPDSAKTSQASSGGTAVQTQPQRMQAAAQNQFVLARPTQARTLPLLMSAHKQSVGAPPKNEVAGAPPKSFLQKPTTAQSKMLIGTHEQTPVRNAPEIKNEPAPAHFVTAAPVNSSSAQKATTLFAKAFPELEAPGSDDYKKTIDTIKKFVSENKSVWLGEIKKAETEPTKKLSSLAKAEKAEAKAAAKDEQAVLQDAKKQVRTAQNSFLNSSIQQGAGGSVVKEIPINGSTYTLTMSKTGDVYLKSNASPIGAGASMTAYYALDLQTNQLVASTVSQPKHLEGLEMKADFLRDTKISQETKKAFRDCKNVLQQFTVSVSTGTRQAGNSGKTESTHQQTNISHLCEKGSITDNLIINFRKEKLAQFFSSYPAAQTQINKMTTQDIKKALIEAQATKVDGKFKLTADKQLKHTKDNQTTIIDNPFILLKLVTHSASHDDVAKITKELVKEGGELGLQEFCSWMKSDLTTDFSLNRDSSLDWKEIIKQTANGIFEMHAKGYAHRDVKGQNIFIDKNNKVFVADFDQAVNLSKEIWAGFGTPGYVSMEANAQCDKRLRELGLDGLADKIEKFKKKSPKQFHQARDVYAFGVTMGQIIEGTASLPGAPQGLRDFSQAKPEKDFQLETLIKQIEFDFDRKLDPEPPKNTPQHLAWRCRDPNPINRPTMKEVVKTLNKFE